jgi:hypothetical protein
MKLLVGGDSFAQFPSGYYLNSTPPIIEEYPASAKGPGFSATYDYLHWSQVIAEQNNGTAKSIGLGGGDINSTVAITVQELLRESYSHCVFSVTQLARDCVQLAEHSPIDACIEADSMPFDSFYNREIIDAAASRNSKSGSSIMFTGLWWHHSEDDIKGSQRHTIDSYFRHKPAFTYIHNGIANLAYLQMLCDQQNVSLVFSCPFYNKNVPTTISKILPNLKLFTFDDVVDQDNWATTEHYKWLRSHYTEDQHLAIAEKFNNIYPNWGEAHD